MAVWRRYILSAALALLVCATLRKTLVTCQSQTEEDPTQAALPSSSAKLVVFLIIVMILIVAGAVCRYRGDTLSDTSAPSLSTSCPPFSTTPVMPNPSTSSPTLLPPSNPPIPSLPPPITASDPNGDQTSPSPLMSTPASSTEITTHTLPTSPPVPPEQTSTPSSTSPHKFPSSSEQTSTPLSSTSPHKFPSSSEQTSISISPLSSEQTATSLPSTSPASVTSSTEQTSTPPPFTSSPAPPLLTFPPAPLLSTKQTSTPPSSTLPHKTDRTSTSPPPTSSTSLFKKQTSQAPLMSSRSTKQTMPSPSTSRPIPLARPRKQRTLIPPPSTSSLSLSTIYPAHTLVPFSPAAEDEVPPISATELAHTIDLSSPVAEDEVPPISAAEQAHTLDLFISDDDSTDPFTPLLLESYPDSVLITSDSGIGISADALLRTRPSAFHRKSNKGMFIESEHSLGVRDLRTIHRNLLPIVQKWREIGLQLGVPYNSLNEIEKNSIESRGRLLMVLDQWLKGDWNPSWESVVDALAHIGEHALADQIAAEYVHHGREYHDVKPRRPKYRVVRPQRPKYRAVRSPSPTLEYEKHITGKGTPVLDRDRTTVQDRLKDLTKEELKSLFKKLGLSSTTVENIYDTSSVNMYRDYLVRSWILKEDRVQEKGGATWESLQSALNSIRKTGITDSIPQKPPHSPPPASTSTTKVLTTQQSYTPPRLSRHYLLTESSDAAMDREELSFRPSRIKLPTKGILARYLTQRSSKWGARQRQFGSPDHRSVYSEHRPIDDKWKKSGFSFSFSTNEPTMKDLNWVARRLVEKMTPLAYQLGLSHEDIKEIEINKRGDIRAQVMEVFSCWKKSDNPYTWEFLIEALQSESVNEKRLANKLKRHFC